MGRGFLQNALLHFIAHHTFRPYLKDYNGVYVSFTFFAHLLNFSLPPFFKNHQWGLIFQYWTSETSWFQNQIDKVSLLVDQWDFWKATACGPMIKIRSTFVKGFENLMRRCHICRLLRPVSWSKTIQSNLVSFKFSISSYSPQKTGLLEKRK